ncbi:putative NRPS-like enzyme [Mollisia scopiformis]|uniref:Putative NRPS-like enzyme n=1 Tax=Mollisia scopiformis TaxID=149040 RepID=A0A194XFP8_MOLSC|nr:putative NRPS-like enzyme [Mollisia scopiformis]KUJ18954.1 putative NRPS-like enzyme [Mollisia scopiformis]
MGDISEPQDTPVLRAKLEEKKLYSFDDVIRERAEDLEQVPLIAYPKTTDGVDDYEFFTGKELNRLVDGAAKALIGMGVQPVYQDTVAAIYGPSTLSYILTIFALGRLGYTTFILSPRLPVSACVSLLSNAKATLLFHAPQYLSLATKTSREFPLTLFPILTRSQYDTPSSIQTPEFRRDNIDGEAEKKKILILMHSSGSTGTPKPIDYRNARLFATFRTAQKLTAFQSVPLFHAHGFISFIQAIFVRKCIFMFNGLMPQTNETVTKAIKGAVLDGQAAEVIWTVPYVLKLLCEGGKDGEGVKVLKRCKLVSCSGSRTPDELGDLLVSEGIKFGTVFGATEVAMILTSLNRPPGDNAWNYLRPPPHIAPFILMRPLPSQPPSLPAHEVVHECVVLDGHVGKMKSNSNDPPNSYHTSDLFIPHPTISNAWKPIGRLDDRITLLNGEKVLPLAIEGRITQHPFVREAVVFGVDRSVPGLLLFRGANARGLSDEEFLDRVWLVIEDANSKAEGFSQISREMIVVLGEEVECPVTDKSSIKRAAVYRDFASVIEEVYVRLECSQEGSLVLGVEEMEDWIMKIFEDMGIVLESKEMDFFSGGVDSLKAIQMRSVIIKSLDLGGNAAKCPSMVVYDSKNVSGLAKALISLRTGSEVEEKDAIKEMEELIQRFSVFEKRGVTFEKEGGSCVVLLTGATGSLGSHILNQLISNPAVSKIICPIRTTSSETYLSRLSTSLSARGFPHLSTSPKILPVPNDITNLPSSLTLQITHIIHCAWPVNFALPLSIFAPHLSTLHSLINLSLTTSSKLLFCSSVGVAISTPSGSIPEHPIPSLHHASATGYARSKLIGERILEVAAREYGADAHILRIGQIVPSMREGEGSMLWNESEMIPLMVRSALVTGVLPDLAGERCSWVDLGTLGRAVVEIAGLDGEGEERLVYNLVSPRSLGWKEDFLKGLKEAGLGFEVVGREEWLKRLKESEADVERNPSRKLLGFWEVQGSGEKRDVVFETRETEKRSKALREMGQLIEGDYVANLLKAWREVW